MSQKKHSQLLTQESRSKQRKMEQVIKQKDESELKECSFKPLINSHEVNRKTTDL